MKTSLPVLVTLGLTACLAAQVEQPPAPKPAPATKSKLWQLEIGGIGG